MATTDVLIVEDDDESRANLRDLVAIYGMTVAVAVDGPAALAALDQEDFRVVLLDVQLPGIGGLDVLAHCASRPRPVRVIMMTGLNTPETVLAALRGRAYDFLPKPIDSERLHETLRRALEAEEASSITVISAQPDWLEVSAPCTREAADRIQSFVQHLETDLPEGVRESTGLAFRELLLNAVEWGGKLNPTERVRVACIRTPRMLMYRIADPGEGFRLENLAHAAISHGEATAHDEVREQKGLRPGGFGLVMIRSIADELVYNERRNEVLFVKYLAP
jgi:CheY-like chemotaxis protein/anti-sigma regulatory factor (Ser/Thr protein kinase)